MQKFLPSDTQEVYVFLNTKSQEKSVGNTRKSIVILLKELKPNS